MVSYQSAPQDGSVVDRMDMQARDQAALSVEPPRRYRLRIVKRERRAIRVDKFLHLCRFVGREFGRPETVLCRHFRIDPYSSEHREMIRANLFAPREVYQRDVGRDRERISPLQARTIEDTRIRRMGEKTQKAQKSHIRAIKDFASSPSE